VFSGSKRSASVWRLPSVPSFF